MADEFTCTFNIRLQNGVYKDSYNPGQVQIDQAAIGKSDQILSIGTSEEDVTLGDISTEGVCILQNMDTTNYVSWGKKDGSGNMQAIGRLKAAPSATEPSFPAIFTFEPGATLRMQANTAACNVRVIVFEA